MGRFIIRRLIGMVGVLFAISVLTFLIFEAIPNGDPALRGFADYRFRDPDNTVIEVEFNRRIWKPLGIMVFYDTGQVAAQASDLSLARMRQSVGGGLTVWSATKVVFRAYVGFGGGEGTHTFVGILPLPGPVAAPYRTY